MTTDQARNDILTFFTTNFDLISINSSLGLDVLPIVIYDNKEKPPQDSGKSWLRVAIRPNLGEQETLGKSGNRRFLKHGILFIQIFTPLGKGLELADYLSDNILDFLEGGETVTHKIPFNEVSPPNDLGNEGTWNQVNIKANFFYENIN